MTCMYCAHTMYVACTCYACVMHVLGEWNTHAMHVLCACYAYAMHVLYRAATGSYAHRVRLPRVTDWDELGEHVSDPLSAMRA